MNHDQFFKRMMRLFLRSFFEVFYPEWSTRLRFERAEWLEQEVFPNPPRGEKRVVDILVKIPIIPADPPRENEPRESMALILIEAEGSTRLAEFRERVYDYTRALREKHGLDVLPIALFLSLRLDGRGTDLYEIRFWERRILTFEYDYVALPGLRASDYEGHANPLALAWSTLMMMDPSRRAPAAAEAMDAVVASSLEIEQKHLLIDFIQSYAPLEESQRRDLNELLVDPKRENTMNFRKTMMQEAMELGLSQGLEKGLSQGLEKGQRDLLVQLCQEKFKQLSPEDLHRRIDSMNLTQLGELGRKLLTAQHPNDLGLIG